MPLARVKSITTNALKKWWCTLLILPFIYCTVDLVYMALRYNIYFAVSYDFPFPISIVYLFTDNFVLIIHEAGHTFFGLFGVRFITILGGSLLQILLPALITAYFVFNRQKIGIQLSLCLLGLSWLDVAIYATDGSARQLPLIGGLGKEAHDWHNLLKSMNALEYDMTFALIFVSAGLICYFIAIVLPFFYKEYKTVNLDLKL